jgi:hypothetical protein
MWDACEEFGQAYIGGMLQLTWWSEKTILKPIWQLEYAQYIVKLVEALDQHVQPNAILPTSLNN